jgi:hypothetical protein
LPRVRRLSEPQPRPRTLPIFTRLAWIAAGHFLPRPLPPRLGLEPLAATLQRVAMEDQELGLALRGRAAG